MLPPFDSSPHTPHLFHLYFPLSFFYPSLKYKTCRLYSLPLPPVTPPPNPHTRFFYLIASRMYQYGGSGYPTSTSTA